MKYLMRDYIYGWHWENFKASYEHGNSAIFNFLAVQLIFVAQIIKTAGWAQLVIASGYFISLAICCLSIFTHPAELRTMYYVCPLTTNEREKLVRNSYIFRVAVHMLILTIGNIFMMMAVRFSASVFIYITINAFIISTLLPYGKKDGLLSYVMALIIICTITDCWQFDILMSSFTPIIEERFLYSIMLLIEFPVCIGYARQVKRKLKSAAIYEEVVL